MSLYGAFDKTKHLDELDEPLFSNEGVLTPAVRKARVLANLGMGNGTAVVPGVAEASSVMITDAAVGISGFRDTRSTAVFKQPAPATATASETLTAAKLLTGIINGTPAAAVNYTLPLATDLETALLALYPGLAVDDAFDFTIQNLSVTDTQDITVLTNTGWTLSGRMVIESNSNTTIATATAVMFRARRTAANAYTLYRISG